MRETSQPPVLSDYTGLLCVVAIRITLPSGWESALTWTIVLRRKCTDGSTQSTHYIREEHEMNSCLGYTKMIAYDTNTNADTNKICTRNTRARVQSSTPSKRG